jgi:hypothetical protein
MEPLSKYQPCEITSVLYQSLHGWVPCTDGEAGFYISLEQSQILLKVEDSFDQKNI